MNNAEMLETYGRLAELSGQMLEAALEGEWGNFERMEKRCSLHADLVMSHGTVPMAGEEGAERLRLLKEILRNDARIRSLLAEGGGARREEMSWRGRA